MLFRKTPASKSGLREEEGGGSLFCTVFKSVLLFLHIKRGTLL